MKRNQKSTGRMPVLGGKSMAAAPGPSGKATEGSGQNMTRLTVSARKATGDQS